MKSDKLVLLGGVAAFGIVAYLGLNSVLKASALESARVDSINKARSIGAFISQDEAAFGTRYREAITGCIADHTDIKLSNSVIEHYGTVVKTAVTRASAEDYSPRDARRWFIEAERAAAAQLPLPEAVLAKVSLDEKTKIEAALTNIDSNMAAIGECLVQAAQK